MSVAVVGGGVFGATAAVELARAGWAVDLYERGPGLFHGASRCNQGRLHGGYHYPRSTTTALAAKRGAVVFAERFAPAIRYGDKHYYLVAATGSLTGRAEYLSFCMLNGLPYREVRSPLARSDTVALSLQVPEAFISLPVLRAILHNELREARVNVHLGTPVDLHDAVESHDLVVDATYGAWRSQPLKYEVCEVAMVKLGAHYAGQSYVVMDGPFMSLDPVPGTGLHMIYDVRHSLHDSADGLPLDRGLIYTDKTHVDAMLGTARQFLCGIGMPQYFGSMFTRRAVLPDVDATDERPTMVDRHGQVVTILSGKIDTAVEAAREVVAHAGIRYHADLATARPSV